MLKLLLLFSFSYSIAGFTKYSEKTTTPRLDQENTIVQFLLEKKQDFPEKSLPQIDIEMRMAFQRNNIFKVRYLSAASLVRLNDLVITNYAKKHWRETNPAFTCPMKERLDLFENRIQEYALSDDEKKKKIYSFLINTKQHFAATNSNDYLTKDAKFEELCNNMNIFRNQRFTILSLNYMSELAIQGYIEQHCFEASICDKRERISAFYAKYWKGYEQFGKTAQI